MWTSCDIAEESCINGAVPSRRCLTFTVEMFPPRAAAAQQQIHHSAQTCHLFEVFRTRVTAQSYGVLRSHCPCRNTGPWNTASQPSFKCCQVATCGTAAKHILCCSDSLQLQKPFRNIGLDLIVKHLSPRERHCCICSLGKTSNY